MAIFQKSYQGYEGPLSPPMGRSLVIFRYALADVFQSRLFAAFFAVCFLPPLILLCVIYSYYNLDLLLQFEVNIDELLVIDGNFFAIMMQYPQNVMLFVMIMAIGPAMISPDIRNNAMPLFLSRPINKTSYIAGKLLVLLFLGSLISWVPGLVLILVQAFLSGDGWLWDNLNIVAASIITSLVWIVSLSLLAFAISACVKWKAVARMVFFGTLLLGSIFGGVVQEIFGGWGGYIVNIAAGVEVLMTTLYNVDSEFVNWLAEMPFEFAVLQFAVLSGVALLVLTRRIRAFQVVS